MLMQHQFGFWSQPAHSPPRLPESRAWGIGVLRAWQDLTAAQALQFQPSWTWTLILDYNMSWTYNDYCSKGKTKFFESPKRNLHSMNKVLEGLDRWGNLTSWNLTETVSKNKEAIAAKTVAIRHLGWPLPALKLPFHTLCMTVVILAVQPSLFQALSANCLLPVARL